MVVETKTNRFITQRQQPKMALITPTFVDGEDAIAGKTVVALNHLK
jgi:hypothetical protein